jgi:hypothetical protein
MIARRRCLTLIKGEHRFVFRYREGQEGLVLSSLVELAGRDESEFDWFDAALLGRQLGTADEHEARLVTR